ncbi:MAG: amidohydrolase family protein, partial [Pseudomonadota bacterium]
MSCRFQLIVPEWIIPVRPRETVLVDHAVLIENTEVREMGRVNDLKTLVGGMDANEVELIELPGHVLTPGFINTHTHAAMTLFRGYADDLPLKQWLEDKLWPAEGQWVDESFVNDGTQVAIAEMLLSGTTCFSDMYFFPNVVAHTAQDMGIRAFVGQILLEFPTIWAASPDEYISKGLEVHDEVKSLSLIETTLSPHAPYTVADASW